MRTVVHLAIGSTGTVRAYKNKPSVAPGEVVVKLTLSIPNEAFRSPFAEAHIEIPEGFIIRPELEAWLEPVEDEQE